MTHDHDDKPQNKRTGRPPNELPLLNTTPERLAEELLKQRPLRDVEAEQKAERG